MKFLTLNIKLTIKLITLFVFFVGCGANDSSESARSPKVYVPLSLEESKKLITPTVYYIPQYDQTELTCSSRVDIKSRDGKKTITVCKAVYDDCVMQGTCQIKKSPQVFLINVSGKVNGERRFSIVEKSKCLYGNGAVRDNKTVFTTMCLDPYFSIAADLSLYKLGEVIYIPSLVGMVLPNGLFHDGYFIVRDTGGSIKGHGRFDFFAGFDSPKNKGNPLTSYRLVDKDTHVPYFIVQGSKAFEILKERNFPFLQVTK